MVCSPVLLSFLSVECHELPNSVRIPGCFDFLQRLFVLIPYSLFSSSFFVFLTYLLTVCLDVAASVHLLLLRTVSFRFVFLFDLDCVFFYSSCSSFCLPLPVILLSFPAVSQFLVCLFLLPSPAASTYL